MSCIYFGTRQRAVSNRSCSCFIVSAILIPLSVSWIVGRARRTDRLLQVAINKKVRTSIIARA